MNSVELHVFYAKTEDFSTYVARIEVFQPYGHVCTIGTHHDSPEPCPQHFIDVLIELGYDVDVYYNYE